MPKKDLTGQVFGRWRVIREVEPIIDKNGKRHRAWECECSCENHTVKIVKQTNLTSGMSKSCGCLLKEYREKKERPLHNDLTGKTFGRLSVISRVPNVDGSVAYNCHCQCGNDVIVKGDYLVSGHKQSCGCLQRDLLIKRNKKLKGYNDYDFSKEYGIGFTGNGTEFLFDKEDYDLIKDFRWNVNQLNYVTAHDENNNRKTIFLHRIIMGIDGEDWKKNQVDHINGNPLDNRKCNLRVVTPSENEMNVSLQKNNTSGVAGVHYNKNTNKWNARINIKANHRISLGAYDNFEDAVRARKEAENKYYGEYSFDNSRRLKDGII